MAHSVSPGGCYSSLIPWLTLCQEHQKQETHEEPFVSIHVSCQQHLKTTKKYFTSIVAKKTNSCKLFKTNSLILHIILKRELRVACMFDRFWWYAFTKQRCWSNKYWLSNLFETRVILNKIQRCLSSRERVNAEGFLVHCNTETSKRISNHIRWFKTVSGISRRVVQVLISYVKTFIMWRSVEGWRVLLWVSFIDTALHDKT